MTRREWLKQNPPPREPAATRELLAQTTDAARKTQLAAELDKSAKCPQHSSDLQRHRNRMEDLFVCGNGPHYLLWTKVGAISAFAKADLTKPLPDLDAEMSWI
jgi:hypothetical protein